MMKKLISFFSLSALLCAGLVSSAFAQSCNDRCLRNIAEQYMEDVQTQDWTDLPWGEAVRYTENNVAMMIGDGYWGAGPGAQDDALIMTDTETGSAVWFGITSEHGQAAYHGVRLKVENRQIVEVESYLGREGQPDLFADTTDYEVDPVFSDNLRSSEQRNRERMIAIVDGYFNTKQLNDGVLFTQFDESCERVTNGVNVTHGELWSAQAAQGCQAQMEIGVYKPVDRIRARRYPVVDVEKGLVVALSLEDHATRYTEYETLDGQTLNVEVEYPNSRGMLEIFKIQDGKILKIEGVSVFSPYYIHSLWND